MKFVATDEIHKISNEEREISEVHKDHEPEEHVCRGCFTGEPDECWAKRHDEETGGQKGSIDGEGQCRCLCHHVVDQCRMCLDSLENDGKMMYRLMDEEGWSIMVPSTVHDMFQEMPKDVREETMKMILADAKAKHLAEKMGDAKD